MKAFWCDCGNNWGDGFTRFLLGKLYNITLECFEPHEADPGSNELFGLGSVLEYVPTGYTGHILGSGFMFADNRRDLLSAKVHILRGYRTLERCKVSSDPVIGDPGLLADAFAPTSPKKEYIHGIVPHYVDREHPDVIQWSHREDTLVIDIRSGMRNVINQIASCEKIVSSSLHGLVVADALGVPSQWIKLSDKVNGGEFKFVDYYSAFNEFPWIEPDIQQAFAVTRTRDTEDVKRKLRSAIASFAQEVADEDIDHQ